MPRCSTFSVNVLLIFDMHDLNRTFFLKSSYLFIRLFALVSSKVMVLYTTIYTSQKSQKSDLSIEVLNLIFLLT